ncbi:RNA 2',3'-cyclic phosphodiesterase [Candidatus Izimaplasma bacterium]|nr:RNA 2',3'-cyclic phosphodiesterase [Candidatus Izimaplasma bacterium]
MRVFIAIEFDDIVKRYLRDVQDVVKHSTLKGNFTYYGNFHLTIKYIGTIYNGEYEDICQVVDDICQNTSPFSIKVGDIGFFNKKNTNIVWVGITKGKDYIKRLFQVTERESTESGFEPELRKYRPHITIGKKVEFGRGGYQNGLPYYNEEIKVTKLTLFESSRIDGVLTYTPLYTQTLGG